MKLSFTPNPTFKTQVLVPVAGQDEPSTIEITFKYLPLDVMRDTHTHYQKLLSEIEEKDPIKYQEKAMSITAQHIMALADGWEFEQEFNEKNIVSTLNAYGAFYFAVLQGMNTELVNKRVKI